MAEALKKAQLLEKLWPFEQVGVVSRQDRKQLPETPLNANDLTPGSKYRIKDGSSGRKFGIQYHGQDPDNEERAQFTRLDEAGNPVFDLYRFAEEPRNYGPKYCKAGLKTLGLTPLDNGQFSSVYVTPYQGA